METPAQRRVKAPYCYGQNGFNSIAQRKERNLQQIVLGMSFIVDRPGTPGLLSRSLHGGQFCRSFLPYPIPAPQLLHSALSKGTLRGCTGRRPLISGQPGSRKRSALGFHLSMPRITIQKIHKLTTPKGLRIYLKLRMKHTSLVWFGEFLFSISARNRGS
jgi:hypothetical protein